MPNVGPIDGWRIAQRGPAPRDRQQERVRVAQVEQARRLEEGHSAEEQRRGQQSSLAEQRPELVEGDEERDQVGGAQAALQDEPGEPVVGRGEPVH